MKVGELAPGLWWWTAEHPDWEPRQSWEPDVRCFYVESDHATIVVDPLVPRDETDRFWRALDRDVARRAKPVAVLLTQAAHARDAAEVALRYKAEVWGHEEARKKVTGPPFQAIAANDEVPGGRVLDFEQQDGSGTPLYFPAHEAIAVGDVFISRDDGLHVWWGHGAVDDAWYRDRLLPSLRRWLELPVSHLLVAHGELVPPGELAAALQRPPDRGE